VSMVDSRSQMMQQLLNAVDFEREP
jgi:hypothetical protein